MNNKVYKPTAKGKYRLEEINDCGRLVNVAIRGAILGAIDWRWETMNELYEDEPYTHDSLCALVLDTHPTLPKEKFDEYIKDLLSMNLIEVVE